MKLHLVAIVLLVLVATGVCSWLLWKRAGFSSEEGVVHIAVKLSLGRPVFSIGQEERFATVEEVARKVEVIAGSSGKIESVVFHVPDDLNVGDMAKIQEKISLLDVFTPGLGKKGRVKFFVANRNGGEFANGLRGLSPIEISLDF